MIWIVRAHGLFIAGSCGENEDIDCSPLLLQIAKSLWARGSPREIEIDTSRLFEQFGVKDPGHFSNAESSNHVEILLNVKIAHNFSEYGGHHEKKYTLQHYVVLNSV